MLRMLSVLLISLLLSGCLYQNKIPTRTGINAPQATTDAVFVLLKSRFPKAKILLSDETYWFTPRTWRNHTVMAFEEARQTPPRRPFWDCDNFAKDFLVYAQRKYARSAKEGDPLAPAMFVRYYKDVKLGDHAEIVFLNPNGTYDRLDPEALVWKLDRVESKGSTWFVGD